ncbi:MAG: HAD family phosphatase [Bacilli bacterium]|nr:HAD family phosphatase [Bacilli bacterium]
MLENIKGIIFDLDGTVLDSCSIWADVDKDFFEKRGLELPSDYGDAIGHIGLDKAADYTIERFNLKEKKEDIIKEWKSGVLEHYKNVVKLKPHAYEFIKSLKKRGIKFCAATANDEDCYKSALINNGIYDDFLFILEVGSIKKGKDSPDVYLECAKRMEVEVDSCAVFEDLLTPIKTAKKAGFLTVAVYEKSCKDEEEKKKEADIYIKDFNELD